MPDEPNVDALAELLYRAEHWELGVVPPFERLTELRRKQYRRKAEFLTHRGVRVTGATSVTDGGSGPA